MRKLLFALFLCGCLVAQASDRAEVEVDHLLNFVSESGCSFIRNGKEHSSEEAADHLRMKFQRGRRHVDTAEDFIDRLASESSWSGKPYTVQCGDRVETSGAWLHRELTAYRQSDSTTAQATAER